MNRRSFIKNICKSALFASAALVLPGFKSKPKQRMIVVFDEAVEFEHITINNSNRSLKDELEGCVIKMYTGPVPKVSWEEYSTQQIWKGGFI